MTVIIQIYSAVIFLGVSDQSLISRLLCQFSEITIYLYVWNNKYNTIQLLDRKIFITIIIIILNVQ